MTAKLAVAVAATLVLPLAWAANPPAPATTSPKAAAPVAAPAPAAAATLKGKVLEVKDVDAYTYLRLKTDQGETWAAVGKAPVKVGADVTIYEPMLMQNFESKTLKRKFDRIVFGSLKAPASAPAGATTQAASPHTMVPGAGGAAAPAGGSGMDMGAMHAGMQGKPVDVKIAKVAKAEGATGRTVAEVNADRTTLKDKPVAIRATVVKVTPEVMGKNWVHLRDGTGAAGDGSNDILVTSKEAPPKLGDVVVAKGVVKTDVNLGSGYAYKVLVEDVSFGK